MKEEIDMKCPYCGRDLHITVAIRGRVRKNPVTVIHSCGNEITITKDDLDAYLDKRLGRISPKRGPRL